MISVFGSMGVNMEVIEGLCGLCSGISIGCVHQIQAIRRVHPIPYLLKHYTGTVCLFLRTAFPGTM